MSQTWIWQQSDWPSFRWDEAELAKPLARARLAQGKLLGAAGLLDPRLSLEAAALILVEDGLTTSAIEGEKFDLEAVRSSVARHLGLPTAGLPAPPRAVDGLVEVLLDATRGHSTLLTLERLCGWQAALFPTGYSGLVKIRVGSGGIRHCRSQALWGVIPGRKTRKAGIHAGFSWDCG